MAATLTNGSELTYLSFPIEKTETTPEGDLLVYGKATDGSVDSDEQIVDPDWSAKAIADWLATGANVRVQHNAQRDPAGVGVEINTGSGGETYVKSLVVEPVAKRLVETKTLRAYSVGIARPKIVRDAVARGGRIVDGEIVEISLVDRPANKNCGIELVKSAGDDGHAEFVGKVFGNSTILQQAYDGIKVPDTVPGSSTFSPGDLAKLLEHRAVAEKAQADASVVEKKDVDPNVGGGTDRDKIPADNFAGRDRSFPIVKPGDVSDAASSIGRAGSDNYSPDKLRQNIVQIANRLGPEYVQQLPESWKSEGADTAEKAKKKGKKPDFGGEGAPAFGSEEDEATKGAKDCPKCGKSYHADAKVRKCEKCGAELPIASKTENEPEAVKKDKKLCAGCGANIDVLHKFCPECGNDQTPAATKSHDFTCLGCSRELDEDEKYCPGCGKENPGYEGANTKASKPTPGAGAAGTAVSDIKPVPAHREPDGTAIESLEHDAGMPTDPDTAHLKTVTRIKSIGVPPNLGSLHDLLCPGFHPDDVAKSHPDVSVNDLDIFYWQSKALDAATGGTLEEATAATALWQHADTIKRAGVEITNDLRFESHKAFRDANQGPGAFPTPTELSPSKFNRPAITAGHASESPGSRPAAWSASVPTRQLDASQFQRGPLTAGHESPSPANKGTGDLTRVSYEASMRNAAASAMSAMHDHISQTFPDLCPMGFEATTPSPVPSTVKSEDPAAPVDPTVAEGIKVKKHKKAKIDKAESTDSGIATLVKQVAALTEQVTALTQNVDALGDLPDPRVQAFKGVGQNPVTKSAGATGVATIAETAERTQRMMMNELETQFRTSPDPAQREAAWNALVKMRGL